MATGKEIINIVVGSHFSYTFHDDPNDEAEADLVGGFIQGLRDWADIWDDIGLPDQMKATLGVSETIKEIEAAGWTIYGHRMKGRGKFAGIESEWEWNAIAVVRGKPDEVVYMDGKISVFRPVHADP